MTEKDYPQYAAIIVNRAVKAVDKIFHYHIPSHLQPIVTMCQVHLSLERSVTHLLFYLVVHVGEMKLGKTSAACMDSNQFCVSWIFSL